MYSMYFNKLTMAEVMKIGYGFQKVCLAKSRLSSSRKRPYRSIVQAARNDQKLWFLLDGDLLLL